VRGAEGGPEGGPGGGPEGNAERGPDAAAAAGPARAVTQVPKGQLVSAEAKQGWPRNCSVGEGPNQKLTKGMSTL
jgi:hypothetical protein